MSDEKQTIAGRYELGKMIGRGGMGSVYQGHDTVANIPVAIKLLHENIVQDNPDMVNRFRREGEALRQLNHPNIVKLLDAVEEEDKHYLVLEYVGGGSLYDLLDGQDRLPLEKALNIALDMADALTRAHRLKIIHRDIKPENVLLTENGTLLLTDFGVAHLGERSRLTQSGSVIGTYFYLSPEACNGLDLDERADIWSFGVMLYEMLAGRLPFQESSATAILTAILTKPAPDLRRLVPDIPPALVNLITRMLEKDRDQRIESMRLVGAELEAIIRNMDTSVRNQVLGSRAANGVSRFATPYDTGSSVPAMESADHGQTHGFSLYPGSDQGAPASATAGDASSGSVTGKGAQRRTRAIITGGALIVLAVVVVGALMLLSRDHQTDSPAPTDTPTFEVMPVESGKHMVLVAALEPLGDTSPQDINRFIVDNLELALVEEIPNSAFAVRSYPGIIVSDEEARAVAEDYGAMIIVWGNYSEDLIELEIQVGVTTDFEYIQFDRPTLEKTANIRVRLTDPRQETIAQPIVNIANMLIVADGDEVGFFLSVATLDGITLPGGEIVGNTFAAHMHRGLATFTHDTDAAISEFSTAISIDASNPIAYVYRALAHYRRQDIEGLAPDMQTASRLGPANWAFPVVLSGPFAESLDDVFDLNTRLIELRPNDWYNYYTRGFLSYYVVNDLAQAKDNLAQAIAHDPLMQAPYIVSMQIALREGRIADAQELARLIVREFPDPEISNRAMQAMYESDPADFDALWIQVGTNLVLGQYPEVVQRTTDVLGEALQQPGLEEQLAAQASIEWDAADLMLMEGLAYCNMGDYEAAAFSYDWAIKFDSDYTLLYLLRGQNRAELGDEAGMRTDFETADEHPLGEQFDPWLEAAQNNTWTCTNFFDFQPGS